MKHFTLKLLYILIVNSICFSNAVIAQTISSEFPNGKALLEYIHGVNKNKVPEIIECQLELKDYYENKAVYRAIEYLKSSKEHITVFENKFGINARMSRNNVQYIMLKNDIVYESEYIDVELLVLLGIHHLSADKSDSILKLIGIDTDIISDAIRLGRPSWIIGADAKQMDVPQIWIDKEYLAVRRLSYINLPQESVQQLEWEDYEDINGFFFPKKMELKNDPDVFLIYERKELKSIKKIPEDIKSLFSD